MPYSKTAWVNGSPPFINAADLNNIEDGVSKAPYGPDASAGWVPVGNGSGGWVYEQLPASSIAGYPSDATKALLGDGSWGTTGGITSGVLASRPTASSNSGKLYYATDQDVLYFSNGTSWTRLGNPAGATTFMFASVSVPTGWVRYDGSSLPGSTGIYADLATHLGGTTTPDTRGRTPVDKGTHTDVDTVGKDEGVATVGNRRQKHRTSNALTGGTTGGQSADHSHGPGAAGYSYRYAQYGSGPFADIGPGPSNVTGVTNSTNTGGTSNDHTHSVPAPGGSIGTNVGTDPLDSGAYKVGLLIAKL